jgi:hypothetical protein
MGSWKITAIFFPRSETKASSVGFTVRSSEPNNSPERKISPEGNDKFFVGASDYSDWLYMQMIDARSEKKISTHNSELKLHGNRQKWKEFIEEEFEGDHILQFTSSSGLIITEGLNFIRYDVNSNSITTQTYGDKIFIENVQS